MRNDSGKIVNTITTNKSIEEDDDSELFAEEDPDEEKARKNAAAKLKARNVNLQRSDSSETPNIIVPKGMDLTEAANWLIELDLENNREYEFNHTFAGYYPLDAIWALFQAVAELHGFTKILDYAPWQKAASISVPTGVNTTQQIPWGPIKVRGLAHAFCPHVQEDRDGNEALYIHNNIRAKDKKKVDRIISKTVEILSERSIYKGKAIEVEFASMATGGHGAKLVAKPPIFIDIGNGNDELIFGEKVQRLLDVNLFTPIRSTQACRDHNIPRRRTILLAGGYGVGKTMTARQTASECVKNGWTYIYVRDLGSLEKALYFAKKYQPAVVFAEDINRITDGNRDAAMDKLLNTLDGVDRKDDEVMVIFTTNDMDDIHPSMLRPGRVDSVITIEPPDSKAAERLVRLYGRGLIADEADLTRTGKMLDGQIPAIIREAVERSKLAAIADLSPGQPMKVQAHHLEIAAIQCLEHAKLLSKEDDVEMTDLEVLGSAFGEVVVHGLRDVYEKANDAYYNSNGDSKKVLDAGLEQMLDDAGRPGKKNGHTTATE
jgi:hypothetical protein